MGSKMFFACGALSWPVRCIRRWSLCGNKKDRFVQCCDAITLLWRIVWYCVVCVLHPNSNSFSFASALHKRNRYANGWTSPGANFAKPPKSLALGKRGGGAIYGGGIFLGEGKFLAGYGSHDRGRPESRSAPDRVAVESRTSHVGGQIGGPNVT